MNAFKTSQVDADFFWERCENVQDWSENRLFSLSPYRGQKKLSVIYMVVVSRCWPPNFWDVPLFLRQHRKTRSLSDGLRPVDEGAAGAPGLVLGCIEAKFCKKICVWKLSPRATQCTPLHSSAISILSNACQHVAKFCNIKIVYYLANSTISLKTSQFCGKSLATS